jgi:transcriptional regulator with XRE-family HTH domain
MIRIKACLRRNGKHALPACLTVLDMTTPYGERLAEAMELANLRGPDARTKLAKAVGITVQSVGQALSGATKALSAENSAKAARFLRVDHYWLATGEGEPRPSALSEDAIAFARIYEELDERERERWRLLVQVARNGVPDQQVEKKMPITAKRPGIKAEQN